MIVVRPELEELTRFLYPTAQVGEPPEEETLFVNGRLCMTDDEVLHFLAASPTEASFMANGVLFAAKVTAKRVAHAARHLRAGNPERAFEDLRFPAEVNAFLARSAADLVRWSPRQIVQDFRNAFQPGTVRGTVEAGVHVTQPEAIHVARGARVQSGAILNAEMGPILIQENATVEPLTYIEGPAVIGERTVVKAGARIRGGSSIGPVCKVGGEVEASVFQGYSNKQHDGFLGHSYVGEWVNLGADTNTSDLKNNYGEVRFFRSAAAYREGKSEGSGQKFLGLTIGDFTKTGIGTSFTTGSVVGIGCNLFGTELMPAYVPSFIWGSPGSFVEHRIDGVIETARVRWSAARSSCGSSSIRWSARRSTTRKRTGRFTEAPRPRHRPPRSARHARRARERATRAASPDRLRRPALARRPDAPFHDRGRLRLPAARGISRSGSFRPALRPGAVRRHSPPVPVADGDLSVSPRRLLPPPAEHARALDVRDGAGVALGNPEVFPLLFRDGHRSGALLDGS